MDAAVAGRGALSDGAIVDVPAGDRDAGRPDGEREGRHRRRAREDVAAVGAAVGGARDLPVKRVRDVRRQVQQRRARVGDAADGRRRERTVADLVAGRREQPVPRVGVDVDVRDVARVLGRVDVAEIIRTLCSPSALSFLLATVMLESDRTYQHGT